MEHSCDRHYRVFPGLRANVVPYGRATRGRLQRHYCHVRHRLLLLRVRRNRLLRDRPSVRSCVESDSEPEQMLLRKYSEARY